jgi:hypothetical protein
VGVSITVDGCVRGSQVETLLTLTASVGRTLSFAGSTITASSGSFTADGWTAGMGLFIDSGGFCPNDGFYVIATVGTTTMTVVTGSTQVVNLNTVTLAGFTTAGPYAVLVVLDGTSSKELLFGEELINGGWGSYAQLAITGGESAGFAPAADATITWSEGPGLPPGFGEWGSDGLWLKVKVLARGTWGAEDVQLDLSVLDPADGTTKILTTTRNVTVVQDSDYVKLQLAKADLDALSLVAGTAIRLILAVNLNAAAVANLYPYVRVGPISGDFGGAGGGGGGGSVQSVTVGDGTITIGGTATDPTVKVTPGVFGLAGDVSAAQADATTGIANAAAAKTAANVGAVIIEEPAMDDGVDTVWGRFGICTPTVTSSAWSRAAGVSRSGNYGSQNQSSWSTGPVGVRWSWKGLILPQGTRFGPLGLSIWHKYTRSGGATSTSDVTLGVVDPTTASTDHATCLVTRAGLGASDGGWSLLTIPAASLNALLAAGDQLVFYLTAGKVSGLGTATISVHSVICDLTG